MIARLLFLPMAMLALLVGMVAPAFANEEFRFDGSGWGHGIGMSQYGAHGKGLAGHTYSQIISHYYSGAGTGPYELAFPLLVGLMQYVGDPVITTNPQQARFISRGGTSTISFGGDTYTMQPDDTWRLSTGNNVCTLTGPSVTNTSHCSATIERGSGSRIQVVEKSDTYSRGSVVIRRATDRDNRFRGFHLTLRLPMEEYLLGLAEMPDSFHMEALKTQVVTARSYATYLALGYGEEVSNSSSRQEQCWCHVYDDTRNQVYRGSRSTVEWPKAVAATTSQVVTAPGSPGTRQGVAQAFYSSSSGGNTENNSDVWGGSQLPYLVTVGDQWALDPAANNPFRSWSIQVPASTVASRVGLDTVTRIDVTERNASGSARTIRFTGTKDGKAVEVTRTGPQTRTLLGLRSAYIHRAFRHHFFVDVDGNVHEVDIAWIAQQAITRGCNPPTNDRYCPGNTVTRAQMAAFMVRALGLTATSPDGNFRDVPSGSTFATDINRLATAGITRGCNPPTNDRYCPDDPVKRDQMASFLARALR
jgi:SpoIID/LytB domain protein